MLRDLEELILSVEDPDAREYVMEAFRCYSAGAYRAAIVLSFAAAMDYMRRSLERLIQNGSGSPALAQEFNKIDQLYRSHEAYERPLIDLCAGLANSITPAEKQELLLLQGTRHLAAHPSGFVGTAETARHVLTRLIDVVLSRPVLLGVIQAEELVEKLKNPGFFPATDRPSTDLAVKTEVAPLHSVAYGALVAKISARLKSVANAPDPSGLRAMRDASAERQNLRRFLGGLHRTSPAFATFVATNVGRLVDDEKAREDATAIVVDEPEIFSRLGALQRQRLVGELKRTVRSPSSQMAIGVLSRKGILEPDEKALLLGGSKGIQHALSLSVALGFEWDELKNEVIRRVLDHVGDWSFETGRAAIHELQNLSEEDAQKLDHWTRAAYVLRVAKASSHDTHPAPELIAGALGPRRNFIESIPIVLETRAQELLGVETEWTEVMKLLVAAKREDLILRLLELFATHGTLDVPRRSTFDFVEGLGGTVAVAARSACELWMKRINPANA